MRSPTALWSNVLRHYATAILFFSMPEVTISGQKGRAVGAGEDMYRDSHFHVRFYFKWLKTLKELQFFDLLCFLLFIPGGCWLVGH